METNPQQEFKLILPIALEKGEQYLYHLTPNEKNINPYTHPLNLIQIMCKFR